jgi:hypothetical protein
MINIVYPEHAAGRFPLRGINPTNNVWKVLDDASRSHGFSDVIHPMSDQLLTEGIHEVRLLNHVTAYAFVSMIKHGRCYGYLVTLEELTPDRGVELCELIKGWDVNKKFRLENCYGEDLFD